MNSLESINEKLNSLSISSGSVVNRAMTAAAANMKRGPSTPVSKHYTVSLFHSMATEQDVEIQDELLTAQNTLSVLKRNISKQSKNNFLLEKDVRFLDSRIALLIQNKMALEESELVTYHEEQEGTHIHSIQAQKMQQYGNLFYLLQSEPRYIASLCRLVNLSDIEGLLQTVMFTLYGNQYESREENLLLTMFQNVLAAQFEAASEFGSLLRANTPVSRMLATYTRRSRGQSYLKSILSDKINELIIQKDINLQINPLKVYEEVIEIMEQRGTLPPDYNKSVTPEYAEKHAVVQEMIWPRLDMLMNIANEFLSIIIQSLDTIPYGIRWICKQIKQLARQKYPQVSETAIASLIGGFFFLRFINPAIVTPQAYMLIDSYPSTNTRTTLTLIAKMLQNLANKPTYSKESYMIPTNLFVTENKQRIHQFLNAITDVPDFNESFEMEQHRNDLSIQITPNEIYNTHALLTQHKNQLVPHASQQLLTLLDELGPAPALVDRKHNLPIRLDLYSRWTDEEKTVNVLPLSVSSERIPQQDLELKSTFVQILRCAPSQITRPLDLVRVARFAADSKDPRLVQRGIKALRWIRDVDNERLAHILEECEHLCKLKERVSQETESLSHVYEMIQSHNRYLRGQLEVYQAYLQNVRMKTSHDEQFKKKECTYSHQQLEKEGIIVETEVPEYRKPNIFLMIQSIGLGAFMISLHYKGRQKPILEIHLKLDDLLEKQKNQIKLLDLEYIKLNSSKLLQLIYKSFKTKQRLMFF